MHQYRISKYDPSLRSPSGAYRLDEWTSRADIGKTFGGVLLTEERYLCTEQAYLETAATFLGEAGITELKVVGLENHGQCPTAPLDGSSIKTEDVPVVLRSLLREDFWCKLECESAFIHVGYDYYMYIGTSVDCAGATAFAQGNRLFAETFKSPYV